MSRKIFKKFSRFQSRRKVSFLLIPCILLFIPLLFFYKTIIFRQVPFPGDLLTANYEPYKSVAGIGAVPNKGQGADVVRELYPWKYLSIESLKQGIFPLWNPYTFSGDPLFASLQPGVLYPVNIIFFVLPFINAWSVYIILQYFLAMIFTYLYLREIKLSKIPSVFGAVAFSFCAFFTVWGEYGNVGNALAFLPLTLFSIEKIYASNSRKWYLLFIFSLVFSFFAGYVQVTMYILILDFIYILAKSLTSFKKDKKTSGYLLLALIAGVLLSAVQILPLYELLNLSLRSNYSYKELVERLMPLPNIITLLVPDFFGNPATRNYFLTGGSSLERAANLGVWPLVFAFYAIFSKKNFHKIFFIVIAVVTYISALSITPVIFIQSVGIPFLSTGVPTRILAVSSFSIAVLAAIGMDSLLNQGAKNIFKVIAFFTLIFIILWAFVFLSHNPVFQISKRNLIIPTAIFILGSFLLLGRFPKKIITFIIVTLTVFELFYSFQKFNSFVPVKYIYPASAVTEELRNIQGINRSWGYGSGHMDPELQIMEKIYTTDGYNPLFSKNYGELLAASGNGHVPGNPPRSVADIFQGYGVNDLKQNPFRQRALNLTGVKYILDKKEDPGVDSAFDGSIYKLVWQQAGWQIYENKDALARIKLFGDYEVKKGKSAVETLYNPNFDFKNTLLLNHPLTDYEMGKDPGAVVSSISYKQNSISLTTNSSKDQLLFISDNFLPGWHAVVDGVEQPILNADYAFRAVALKAGKHKVYMYYFPDSFKWGIIISTLSFIGLILLMFSGTIRKRFQK